MRPYISSEGDFNHLPTPAVECDIARFWKKYFYWTPEVEFRQLPGRGNCRLFWFSDCAYAIVDDHKRGTICYRIGCVHTFTRSTVGPCLHQSTCTKCGYIQVVDSSD